MNKYEKIIRLFKELLNEISTLSERETKILISGIELSLLTDRINQLNKKGGNK